MLKFLGVKAVISSDINTISSADKNDISFIIGQTYYALGGFKLYPNTAGNAASSGTTSTPL